MPDRPMFPKPKDQKREPKPWFKEFADGRLVYDCKTKRGREEYRNNTKTAYERQGRKCGLMITPQCKEKHGRWLFAFIQLDHSNGRGAGGAKRDDRIWDDKGKPMNMAVCPYCQIEKGSRPLSAFQELVP